MRRSAHFSTGNLLVEHQIAMARVGGAIGWRPEKRGQGNTNQVELPTLRKRYWRPVDKRVLSASNPMLPAFL